MSLRDLLQQNPAVAAIVSMLVLIGSAIWMARGDGGGAPSEQVYFYDLKTNSLFAGGRVAQPPIDAPSGANNGVKAAVYTCGACTASNFEIAFITTYSDRARVAMEKKAGVIEGDFDIELEKAIDMGMLVAVPPEGGGEPEWVPAMTPQGILVTERVAKLCGEKPAKPCLP